METLANGRIRITGTRASRGVSQVEEAVAGARPYFRNVYFRADDASGQTFEPNSLYFCKVKNAPRLRRGRVTKDIHVDTWRRRSYVEFPSLVFHSETSPTKEVVGFTVNGAERLRGIFFKEAKSLVFGDLSRTPQYNRLIVTTAINYLTEHGLIEVLPSEATAGAVLRTIEIHRGEQKIVNLNAERILVTAGCDPEFEYISEQSGLPIMPPDWIDLYGRFGKDGQGKQIELRNPGGTPSEVRSYTIGLMEAAKRAGVKLGVRGDFAPLGAHIHCGLGHGYTPAHDLTWLFDQFLGKKVIDLSGSARGSYKGLSNVRSQPHGFEYRTPPSAIFATPEMARICMKIVQRLTECFINEQTMEINNPLEYEDYWNYAGLLPSEYAYFQDFLNSYRTEHIGKNVVEVWTQDEYKNRYPQKITSGFNDSGLQSRIALAERPTITRPVVAPPRDEPLGSASLRADAARRELEVVAASGLASAVLGGEIFPEATHTSPRFSAEDLIEQVRRASREIDERPAVITPDAPARPVLLRNIEVGSVIFNDDWTQRAVDVFCEAIRGLEGLGADERIQVFGLGASRGHVTYGYSMDDHTRMEDGAFNYGHFFSFGVPAHVRISHDVPVETIRAHAERVVSTMLNTEETLRIAREEAACVDENEEVDALVITPDGEGGAECV